MSIAFTCPQCAKNYQVPDTFAGKRAKCKQCGALCQVPGNAAVTAAPPPRAVVPAPYPEPAPAQGWQGSPGRSGGARRGLIFAAIAVCGLVLLSGASYGVYKIFFGGSSIADDLKYLPADVDVIASVRLEELMASDTWKDVEKQYPDMLTETKKMQEETSLAPDDISKVVVGLPFSDPENAVIVIHTKKAVEGKDLIAKHKDDFNEVKVGNYTVYEQKPKQTFVTVGQQLGSVGDNSRPVPPPPPPPPAKAAKTVAICAVDSKLVIVGPGVKAVLERDKKPELSEGMQSALKAADFSKPVVVVVNLKDAATKAGKNFGQLGVPVPPAMAEGFEAAVVEATVTSEIKITATVYCKDSAKAEETKKQADEGLTQVKPMVGMFLQGEAKAAFDSLEITQSGNKLIATTKFKLVPLIQSVPAGMGPTRTPMTKRAIPSQPPGNQ